MTRATDAGGRKTDSNCSKESGNKGIIYSEEKLILRRKGIKDKLSPAKAKIKYTV